MRKLRVWGSSFGTKRRLVAAHTQKQARDLAEQSYTAFKDYWSETDNEYELSVANKVGYWEANSFKPISGGFISINKSKEMDFKEMVSTWTGFKPITAEQAKVLKFFSAINI